MNRHYSGQYCIPALHVGRPNIGKRQQLFKRMEQLLDQNWLTNNGPLVQEFEKEIARYLGVQHCIATCNGTLALELAIRALGLTGEVIVPSLTFVATAHALQWQEIQPVFCDIDPATCCIAPDAVERLITSKTSGIIGVHLYGRRCDVASLQKISRQYKLSLFFDAAHAFGCACGDTPIGNFGDCEVFSFHATKVLNAFEGGAVVTNNERLAEKIRLMKNFGFSGEDNVIYLGTNGKMTEMSAAMGLTNLESLDEFIAVNRSHWQTYKECLSTVEGISLLPQEKNGKNNYQYVVLRVDADLFGMTRDCLKDALEKQGILARRYFFPGCHRMEPYAMLYPEAGIHLQETEKFCQQVLVLPTGSQATTDHIRSICTLIADLQEKKNG